MARTIEEIKTEIGTRFVGMDTVQEAYGLNTDKAFEEQFSKVSIESILFYVISASIWILEKLFDTHKVEVTFLIDNLKPHTTRWYANKAKAFQLGFDLLVDSDQYNNAGKTEEQVAASKIVKYAAVVEATSQLLIKVAAESGNDLTPLSAIELGAFRSYIMQVKDAGVKVELVNETADSLRLSIDLYYNPLVLDSTGKRLDDTSYPVMEAIKIYLKQLPFNGVLVMAYLVDYLQRVEGVVVPHVVAAQYQYGGLDWADVGVLYQPYSGYLRINNEADLTINYIAQTPFL